MMVIGIIAAIILIAIVVGIVKTSIKKREKTKRNNDLLDAVGRGDKQTVQNLISEGVNINDIWNGNYGGYPLQIAVENRDKEMALFLIEKGAQVNYGKRPLIIAVQNGDKDMVSLLINKGAKVNLDFHGKLPLDFAENDEIIALLKSHGAITKAEQDEAEIDFVYAVKNHDTEQVKRLIPKIWDYHIDIIPSNSDKPNMPKDIFEFVYFHYNRNTNGVEEYKQGNVTPLIYAAGCDDVETVKLLVENGANVNAQTSDGITALMNAVMMSDVEREHTVELVDFLISKGANVNAKTYDVYNLIAITALMFAVMAENTEAVMALIRNGANVNEKASNGVTALSIAEYKGYTEIAAILRKSGAWR